MIIGHKNIRERLRRSAESGKAAQAYLFYGPESVGKFLVAKEFAIGLIGASGFEDGDEKDPLDLLILRPSHEEEKGVEKEKEIGIEEVRDMQRQLTLLPYAGARRVLIVDNAHKLTESAQNALLKVLEEPPLHAAIILVTHESGRMLPTIVSRCQRVAFSLVGPEEIEAMENQLGKRLPAHQTWVRSLGRPGVVSEALSGSDLFHFAEDILPKLFRVAALSLHERLQLAEAMAAQPWRSLRVMEWWLGWLHLSVSNTGDQGALAALQRIEETLGLLKKSSGSNRLILENLLVNWETLAV